MSLNTLEDTDSLVEAAREAVCRIFGEPYNAQRWADWRWQSRHRLTRLAHFEALLSLTDAERRGRPTLPPSRSPTIRGARCAARWYPARRSW